jgi:NAD(P)-dependent dehydrogenase (short-subunit alcohol dehydrogenase family)
MDLGGKCFLVTGSARRLGREIALALASAGADIVIHHFQSPDKAEEVAASIRSMGRKTCILQADLSETSAAGQLVARAWEFAPISGIVNNAAVFYKEDWFETSIESWEKTLSLNLTAPFLISQSFAKQLSEMEFGHIVNILDWRALRPGEDHLAYTVSKSALAALTRSLAQAFAPHIAVNALALGAVLAPEGEPVDPNLLQKVPLKRWAKLDEVTSAVQFLLTTPPDITGTILLLDGGRHLN